MSSTSISFKMPSGPVSSISLAKLGAFAVWVRFVVGSEVDNVNKVIEIMRLVPLCIRFEAVDMLTPSSSSDESDKVDAGAFRLLPVVVQVVVVCVAWAWAHRWEDNSWFAALSALVTFAKGAAVRLERISSPSPVLVPNAIILERQECTNAQDSLVLCSWSAIAKNGYQSPDNGAWPWSHKMVGRAISPYRPSPKAWLGQAYGGLAWPGSGPQARPSKSLGRIGLGVVVSGNDRMCKGTRGYGKD